MISDHQGRQKIGFSGNPYRRLNELMGQLALPLTLAIGVPVPKDIAAAAERYAHWLLRDHHAEGGWFWTSMEGAVQAIDGALVAVRSGKEAPGRIAGSGSGKHKSFGENLFIRALPGMKATVERLRGAEAQGHFLRRVSGDVLEDMEAGRWQPRTPPREPKGKAR